MSVIWCRLPDCSRVDNASRLSAGIVAQSTLDSSFGARWRARSWQSGEPSDSMPSSQVLAAHVHSPKCLAEFFMPSKKICIQ